MASNKLYKPGQLITVVCKESTMLCRITKRNHFRNTCIECEKINGIYISDEICVNMACARLGLRCYPKVIKRWIKQT